MGWTSKADVPLRFVPSSATTPPNATLPVRNMEPDSTITLRQLLTNHLDIIAIPRRSFFAQLAHYTSDEFHKARLLEFTDPQYLDELYDYTTRPRRSILEVLQEFESVNIPWQRVCSIIPTIRGRQFSIASAMNPTAGTEKKTKIELLIAIVKYKTVIKRTRQGVATRYIASLTPGQQITVTLSQGGLGVGKEELNRPVVMVGPGTGVAPMRSLIYQRILWRDEHKKLLNGDAQENDETVKDLLFFGCRNAESDYFFKDEWSQLQSSGVPLEVYAAFSRDQVGFRPPPFRPNTNQIIAPESLRSRPSPPAIFACLLASLQQIWRLVHLRLLGQDASSRTRSAYRSFPRTREYG
jgi:sulfite reductase alpha subunit-like flavoprotein